MQIALVNLAGMSKGSWLEAWAGGAKVWQNMVLTRLDEARVALEEIDSLSAVVYFENPRTALASSLRHGMSSTASVRAWEGCAEDLLAFVERFEGRVALIQGDVDLSQLDKVAVQVERGLGVRPVEPASVDYREHTPQEDDHPDTATFQIAASLLLQLRRPAELLNRLNENLLTGADTVYPPDLVSLFLSEERTRMDERHEALAERALLETQLKRERDGAADKVVVLEQLHRTQEELENVLQRYRELNHKVQALRKGRTYRKNKIDELENRLAALRRGRNSRRETIAELERELQQRETKIEWLRKVGEKHRGTAQMLRVDLKEARSRLKRVEGSRSWRYTRILRRVNDTEA